MPCLVRVVSRAALVAPLAFFVSASDAVAPGTAARLDSRGAPASGTAAVRVGGGAAHVVATGWVGAAAATPGASEVFIGIDPSVDPGRDLDLAALRAEGRAAGPRVLSEQGLLRGRVVVDGLLLPAGTRAFVEAGATIISTGANLLEGTLVVVPREHGAGAATSATLAFDLDVAIALAALGGPDDPCGAALTSILQMVATARCGPTAVPAVADGVDQGSVAIVFLQDTEIAGDPFMVVTGPIAVDPGIVCGMASSDQEAEQLGTDTTPVIGAPSIAATGGAGGAGIDVTIAGVGGARLLISGALCNARGADGGAVHVQGADGQGGAVGGICPCGGDAIATGGAGGRAGALRVSASEVHWGHDSALVVHSGGHGGLATATGGSGATCECPLDGGRGGHAVAQGGAAGASARVSVVARRGMVPSPNVALTLVSFGPPAHGGAATASSGRGGIGGSCSTCVDGAIDGGDGGSNGSAFARGGDGGDGYTLLALSGGIVVGSLGSDGGTGGAATATMPNGSAGGFGAPCPCEKPSAGSGGDGGDGGTATACGGAGGGASGGPFPINGTAPTSGAGGGANAICFSPGDGANGGNCFGTDDGPCAPGTGGASGSNASTVALGGAAGAVLLAATAGAHGTPVNETTSTCGPGADGTPGQPRCNGAAPCCAPSPLPGCDEPGCQALVCGADAFCCEVAWDVPCANLAQELCPQCGGGATR